MINDSPAPAACQWYLVTVGLARVQVQTAGPAAAIAAARTALAEEHPRLYDLVHRLDDSRFCVEARERIA